MNFKIISSFKILAVDLEFENLPQEEQQKQFKKTERKTQAYSFLLIIINLIFGYCFASLNLEEIKSDINLLTIMFSLALVAIFSIIKLIKSFGEYFKMKLYVDRKIDYMDLSSIFKSAAIIGFIFSRISESKLYFYIFIELFVISLTLFFISFVKELQSQPLVQLQLEQQAQQIVQQQIAQQQIAQQQIAQQQIAQQEQLQNLIYPAAAA